MGEALWVGLGGGLGAALRYGVGAALAGRLPFWAATLAVNVLGSFVLGAIFAKTPSGRTYILGGTGFCGGFTTFSTFSLDAVRLWNSGQKIPAAMYAGVSLVLSVAALVAGFSAAGGKTGP
mgnify:CR=1 FL=1